MVLTRALLSCRQSPRVDPLYLAPSSPRRSNPATPRSSPALSPVPLAPLSAAAVGLGLMSSPAGTAPAAAMGATRSASSSGSRQCLSFSAGGRAVAGRSSAHQQQQREGAGSTRRVASAPPTPSAVAPSGAHRAPGPGAGSNSGNGSYSARRSSVSHESLYCQRLAYSSQRSTVAPGVRKTDRVARFQQMQQQWSRDRCAGLSSEFCRPVLCWVCHCCIWWHSHSEQTRHRLCAAAWAPAHTSCRCVVLRRPS